jgi:hypothetical protein
MLDLDATFMLCTCLSRGNPSEGSRWAKEEFDANTRLLSLGLYGEGLVDILLLVLDAHTTRWFIYALREKSAGLRRTTTEDDAEYGDIYVYNEDGDGCCDGCVEQRYELHYIAYDW